ncbi:MAG: phosphatidylserine/phosphatidylglycerophosphate/cardiolipin synthase family protein [bacterium]|nr:phosphatidylserine/phosphatidylglycerophosphate/cardiolipin synthase family protein [bacterium]
MKYKFFTKSDKAWGAMLEAVNGAQKSIYLESFILTDDPETHHFLEVLKTKAKHGIRVKIVIDRAGSFWFGTIDKQAFAAAGVEVLIFNRWINHSHRKLLIVDEEIGFIGGVNLRGEYADWLDLHLRVTGVFVKRLRSSFAKIYYLSGGRDEEVLKFRKWKFKKVDASLYKAKTWLLERWPFHGRRALINFYKKKCAEAKNKITIVTPYFVPQRWLFGAVKKAAKRGVKIEVIMPGDTDHALVQLAHRYILKNLSPLIDFFIMPEMNHAKVLLVDDHEGLVGSNNMDAQSFDFNLEASVVFQRKDMVGDLKNILDKWKTQSVKFSAAGFQRRWYDKILEYLVSFIYPIL